jgi:hypothetical protein
VAVTCWAGRFNIGYSIHDDLPPAELEEIIARTSAGESVVYDGREIGSTDSIAEKLSQLKLSRSSDPDYVIFVGVDNSGECLLTAFPTIGDPVEFRAQDWCFSRHRQKLRRKLKSALGMIDGGIVSTHSNQSLLGLS